MRDFELMPMDGRGQPPVTAWVQRMHLRLRLDGGPVAHTESGEAYVPSRAQSPGVSNAGRLMRRFCKGRGLDVGASYFSSSASNGFPGAVPVDVALAGSGRAEALVQGDATQDYVVCSHVLEHLEDPEVALREARRVLRVGGVLFTYSPFPGHAEWDPGISAPTREDAGGHRWQPSPSAMCRLLVLGGFAVEYAEWGPDHLWSFAVVGRAT